MTPSEPAGRLGLWSATGLVVGYTIGVGIFLTPAELVGALAAPALTLALWVVCGSVVLTGALTFGELAARYPQSGGLYVYLREAWGPRVAFLYGWQSLLIMDPGVTAALAVGGSGYIALLWPASAGAGRWVAVALIWAVALVNIAGLRFGTRVFGLLTALKVGTLAALVLVAFATRAGQWAHFVPLAGTRVGAPPLGEALAVALVGAFFSFGGFWETSRIAGEVRDPRRTLPRALVLGVVSVTVIYLMTTAAFIYLVPPAEATSASEFARLAGEALFGPPGPRVFAAVVVLSVVPSAMAMLMVSPRLYEAMSLDGLFPAGIAVRHHATGTPVRATMLLATLATALVLIGTFDQIVAFFVCTTLGFVALAAGAVFVVRRRGVGPVPFQVPGYPVTPALFLLLVAAVITLVAATRPVQAFSGFALVLLGVPVSQRLVSAKMPRLAEGGDR
jgi:basic amino acid/polyamine antiporter, APA family